MVDMGLAWMMRVLAVGAVIADTWIVKPWILKAMAGLFITSMLMRNLQVRFWPLLRGASPLQFDNERPELLDGGTGSDISKYGLSSTNFRISAENRNFSDDDLPF